MSTTASPIDDIELNIERFSTGSLDRNLARKSIRHALIRMAGMPDESSLAFSGIFEHLAKTMPLPESRQISTLAIRLISCDDLLPENIKKSSRPHLFKLIEQGNEKIVPFITEQKTKMQSHERLAAYIVFHTDTCKKLQILTKPISNLEDLNVRRQDLMRMLNQGSLKCYLDPLGFQDIIRSISSILKLVDKTTKSHDHGREFRNNLQSLLEIVSEEISQLEYKSIFFVRNYTLPFLRNVKTEVDSLQTSMAERFDCRIEPPADVYEIVKNTPCRLLILDSRSTYP